MTTTIDRPDTSADAFAERVFGTVLDAADTFAMYLGERLGLYRAIADHGPITRDELTRHADIHWRYAQEWLEHQAVSGILEVEDPELGAAERRYRLPEGHAEVLLDPESLGYLAPFVRMVVGALTRIEPIVDAYRTGGGVSWAEYGAEVRTGQAEMNRPWYLQSIGTEWFPAIDDLHELLQRGGRVADVGCGEGWSSVAIALAYPEVEVDGFDVDGPSIEAARRNAAEAGVAERVRFHQVDAAELDADGAYDAVVGFEFIHDLPHPVDVLAAMRRMAKPGAPVVVMDERVGDGFAGRPDDIERLMYSFSLFICLPDGMSHQPSAATGTVIRPETMRQYARQAGFADAEIAPVDNELWRFYRLR